MFARTIIVKESPIRIELERDVTSHNKCLKAVVKSMSIINLLRETHPLYREGFAIRLCKEGLISESEMFAA